MNKQSGIALPREWPDEEQVESWSLVLSAAGIPHRVVATAQGFGIVVSPRQYDRALAELSRYEDENVGWGPKAVAVPLRSERFEPTLLLLGALAVFFVITGPESPQNSWFSVGAVSARKFAQSGEWWRVLTGLTLHADLSHLLGNLTLGGLLIHSLASQLGRGTGWLLVVVAGALGNLANCILRDGGYEAIGFSTSVFAAVGLLCGLLIARRDFGLRQLLLPLGAGLALLAFLGTEGDRTDIGAHVGGLLVGLPLGVAAGLPQVRLQAERRPMIQNGFLILAVLFPLLAWLKALGIM